MATTVQPASRIRANSFCRSGDSGVVRSACSMTPAILLPTVPMTPQRLPATLAMCSTRYVVVVLPFVPVMPTSEKAREGLS